MPESIYLPNIANTTGCLLGEQSDRMIACLGINPSTARREKLDRTMFSLKRIAAHNGYSGYLMFNIYPQRATKKKLLFLNN